MLPAARIADISMRTTHIIACSLLVCTGAAAQVFRGYSEDSNTQSRRRDERRGEIVGYYESGAVQYRATHKRGKLDELAREYYEDGVLKVEITFKNGRRHGIARYYYPSGMLKARIHYRRDKETDGSSRYYQEDGSRITPKRAPRMHPSVLDTLQEQDLRDLPSDDPPPPPQQQE